MWAAITSLLLSAFEWFFGKRQQDVSEKLGQTEADLATANAALAAQKRSDSVTPVDAVDELRKHDF